MSRHFLKRWKQVRHQSRKPVSSPGHRPKIEDLEDRCVPAILFDHTNLSLSDNGGPVLAAAQVRLIFWGNGWNTPGGSALRTQVQNAIDTINSSPYFYSAGVAEHDLSQYRSNIRSPHRVASLTTTYHSPGTTFTDADVSQMLKHGFGSVSDMVYYYYVIPDPNSVAFGFASEHNYWSQFTPPLHEYYGVSRNLPLGTPGELDDLTASYSRDMVESITDPAGTAIQIGPRDPVNWHDIAGGGAEQYGYRLNGVWVQSYWSKADQAYMVPVGQKQDFRVSANHELEIDGGQAAVLSDTATLDVMANGVRATLNGETVRFDPFQINSIRFHAPDYANLNIERTLFHVPVTAVMGIADDQSETVNLSPTAHDIANIAPRLPLGS
jgi:hypothetical protein